MYECYSCFCKTHFRKLDICSHGFLVSWSVYIIYIYKLYMSMYICLHLYPDLYRFIVVQCAGHSWLGLVYLIFINEIIIYLYPIIVYIHENKLEMIIFLSSNTSTRSHLVVIVLLFIMHTYYLIFYDNIA